MEDEYDKPVVKIGKREFTLYLLVRSDVDWSDIMRWHREGDITEEEFERVRHFFSEEDGQILISKYSNKDAYKKYGFLK